MRSHLLPAVVAALALAAAGRAAEPSKPPLVTRVFQVADLVTPIPDAVLPGRAETSGPADRWKKPTVGEAAAQLTRLITATVRPSSWERTGGPGSVEFFETGCAFRVTNTPGAVAEVARLLDGMRRLQDVSVSCEVKILKAPVGFCARAGLKPADDAVLTDREVRAVVDAARGDRDVTVTRFPKLTTFDGQIATVRAGEQQYFATSLEAVRVNGEVVSVPINKPSDLGDSLVLCGRISADEQNVTLRAHFTRTKPTGPVALVPVTTRVTPVFQGEAKGQPVPFTQYLQTPQLDTKVVEKTAVIPDGGTVVLGSWKETGDRSKAPPAMGTIPYVNRLFKTVGPVGEYEVVALATVRIIRAEAEVAPEAKPAALPVAPLPRAVRAEDAGADAVDPVPPAGGPARPVLTCPRVAPCLPQAGARPDLLPEMEVAIAEANVCAALADPAAPNRAELLELARARYQRALAKAPRNEAALRGLARMELIAADEGRPSSAPPAVVPPPANVRELVTAETAPSDARAATPVESVVVRMTVARVPRGFVADAGLADAKAGDFEDKWVLTDRESRLFMSALRRQKAGAILTRPTIAVADRQTAVVQVGAGASPASGLTARVTPAFTADGRKIVLRAEITEPGGQATTTTETVPFGGTLVVRAARTGTGDGTEGLILVTVDQPSPPAGPRSAETSFFHRRW